MGAGAFGSNLRGAGACNDFDWLRRRALAWIGSLVGATTSEEAAETEEAAVLALPAQEWIAVIGSLGLSRLGERNIDRGNAGALGHGQNDRSDEPTGKPDFANHAIAQRLNLQGKRPAAKGASTRDLGQLRVNNVNSKVTG